MREISQLIVRMAVDNPGWGYTRIQGALANLDHKVGRGTIANVLKANGVEPHAYLSAVFARLPHLTTVEDYEALLPWNIRAAQPSSSRRSDERQPAVC